MVAVIFRRQQTFRLAFRACTIQYNNSSLGHICAQETFLHFLYRCYFSLFIFRDVLPLIPIVVLSQFF
jgi:hypothetical protein